MHEAMEEFDYIHNGMVITNPKRPIIRAHWNDQHSHLLTKDG